MATRKFISRKTKKNARAQKGGGIERLKVPKAPHAPKVQKAPNAPNTPFQKNNWSRKAFIMRKPLLQQKQNSHTKAVRDVVDAADYFKKAASVKITNPDGTTRISYNSGVLKNFLKERGHSNNVVSRVARIVSDRGIGNAAREYGIEYTRPQPSGNSKGKQLLGLSKTIRNFHNTLPNSDKANFINFINKKTKNSTNPLTPQNTARIVLEYQKDLGTYTELR